jgi:hypothetical protein
MKGEVWAAARCWRVRVDGGWFSERVTSLLRTGLHGSECENDRTRMDGLVLSGAACRPVRRQGSDVSLKTRD